MDFASFNETVTISAAVFPQRTCVDIQVFEDNTVETLEGFTVVLGPPMDDRVLLNVSILAIDIVDTSGEDLHASSPFMQVISSLALGHFLPALNFWLCYFLLCWSYLYHMLGKSQPRSQKPIEPVIIIYREST